MFDEIKKYCLNKSDSLNTVLKKMNKGSKRILFVVHSDNTLLGSITDGDIRRWILSRGKLDGTAEDLCNVNAFSCNKDFNEEEIKKKLITAQYDAIPVVDADYKLIKIVFRESYIKHKNKKDNRKLDNISAIIMAGGKGTRMSPFTNILPKPLIPIGDKTILQIIMDNFKNASIDKFYLSINYKSKIIKAFFEEIDHSFNIDYLEETEPLGTAGSLSLIEDFHKYKSVFVSNCDIIINADYYDIYSHHKDEEHDITIVTSVMNHRVPYGVCEINNGGTLKEIREKPEYNFLVNTGFYLIKTSVLEKMQKNIMIDFPDLINSVKNSGGKVGVYPIGEESWIDIGEWDAYRKSMEKMKL